jgi:tetratricopeptide (TPR) repeat protein
LNPAWRRFTEWRVSMIRERLTWAIAVAVLVTWAVGLRGAIRWHAGRHSGNVSDDGEAERRRRAVALIPELEPPPDVVGAADVERLDARAVVALLRAGRTVELGNVFERAQELFERDARREQLVESLFEGMRFAGPDDARRLDEWVAANPASFVPFVARAMGRIESARREPSPRRLRGRRPELNARAREQYRLARLDLERAVALRPTAVVAYGRLIRVGVAEGSPPAMDLLARAIAVCPTCFTPRAQYIVGLRPRWGGSREAMAAFAVESQKYVSENTRLRSLLGYADLDDCLDSAWARRYDAAVTACDRAIASYPAAPFWVAKATALHFLGKHAESAEAASNALAARPFGEEALVARARAYADLDDAKAAAEDVKLVLQLAPGNGDAAEVWLWLLGNLELVAEEALAARNPHRALEAYDVLLRVAPSHPKFRNAGEHVRARFGLSPSHGSSG